MCSVTVVYFIGYYRVCLVSLAQSSSYFITKFSFNIWETSSPDCVWELLEGRNCSLSAVLPKQTVYCFGYKSISACLMFKYSNIISTWCVSELLCTDKQQFMHQTQRHHWSVPSVSSEVAVLSLGPLSNCWLTQQHLLPKRKPDVQIVRGLLPSLPSSFSLVWGEESENLLKYWIRANTHFWNQ